jgi:hypothetical protein
MASDGWLFDRLKAPGQPRAVPHGSQWVSPNRHSIDSVAQMSNMEKLRRAIVYALSSPELSGEVQRALRELLNPTNLAIAAGVLATWIASHAIGVGEVFDVALAGVLYASLGAQAVRGLVELVEFGHDIIQATTDQQLHAASSRLTRAITLLGVDVALALLIRRAQLIRRGSRTKPKSSSSEAPPAGQEGVGRGAGGGAESATASKPPIKPQGVLDSQARHVTKIDNIIQDHAKPHDFDGVAKELAGERIPKPGGGYWDHVGEMKQSVKDLQKHVRVLENSLKDPSHSPAVRSYIQGAIDKGTDMISRMQKALSGGAAGGQ